MLALQWSGWRLGEPHLQTGMSLKRSFQKKLKDVLFGCHYVSAYDLTDTALNRNLEILEESRLQCLWGYPGSLYFLARRAIEKGWNRPLKSIVTWGDNLLPAYRKTIEQAFRARVLDTYGCGEGIQVSAQCEHGLHYHIHALDTVVEFLDDHGGPVAPGQRGRIVLTRLHPGPMPLIRYEVGDVGVPGGGERCSCGRGLPLMKSIDGRTTDVVITPAGNRLIVHFFTGILEYFREIDTFQVVQETVEDLVVRIVPTKEWRPESEESIRAALVQKGISGMKVHIETVKEIPLTPGGKRRFIISKVGPVRSG
jgi:phenylacetate-CoA ligase